MADYKERFEKWQREAKDRFDDIDKQIGLKDKLAEGAKVAKETAETFKEGARKIRTEAENSEVGRQAVRVAEETVKTAEATAKKAWEASEPLRDAAEDAGGRAEEVFTAAGKSAGDIMKTVGQKAGEVFSVAGERAGEVFTDARQTFGTTAERISKAFNFGASWTRTIDSAIKTVQQTSEWIVEKPLQAATTGASIAVGAGLGVAFTGISSHWFLNSTVPTFAVKKAAEQFKNHLEAQDELFKGGELSQAEAEKLHFERDIAKYVGAPLLGAFSFASGAMMMTNIFNPKTITGAPIDWITGGSPLLEGVWFFGNGLVCFKTSYDFFMFSLEDHEDVQKIVREIKGFLPV